MFNVVFSYGNLDTIQAFLDYYTGDRGVACLI